MDVRCEKCQTEYELDEARLKPGGVTVKCTNCGHMFKIRKRSSTNVGQPAVAPIPSIVQGKDAVTVVASAADRGRPTSSKQPVRAATGAASENEKETVVAQINDADSGPAGAGGERQWRIRLENGETKSCRELATLQQWIVAGVATRESLISRSGKTWKRLGDISELASYFAIADEARATRTERSTKPPAEKVADKAADAKKTAADELKKGGQKSPTMMGIGATSAAGGTILPDEDDHRVTGRRPIVAPPPMPPARTPPMGAPVIPSVIRPPVRTPPMGAVVPNVPMIPPAPPTITPAIAAIAAAPTIVPTAPAAPAPAAPAPAVSPVQQTELAAGPARARRPITQPPPPPAGKRSGSQSGPLPPPPPPSNRSTAGWANDAVRAISGDDDDGPRGFGKITANPSAASGPAFAGKPGTVRNTPGDDAVFQTGKVQSFDDDDDMMPVRRGSSAGKWIAIGALLVMTAVAATIYLVVIKKPASTAGTVPIDAAAQVVVVAADAAAVAPPPVAIDAAVAPPTPEPPTAAVEIEADVEPRMQTALTALAGKDDGASLAMRARLSAAIAQDLLDRAGLLADRAEADKLRHESKQLVLDAAPIAQRALKAAGGDANANLAMAEVLRLQGKSAREIRRYLDVARGKAGSDKQLMRAVSLADALVLARDGKLADAQFAFAAIDRGDDALDKSGDVRARFHQALALAAMGRPADAKALVDSILAVQADHAAARALAAKLATTVATTDPLPPEDGSQHPTPIPPGPGSAVTPPGPGSAVTPPGPGSAVTPPTTPGPGSVVSPTPPTHDPGVPVDVGGGGDYDKQVAKANQLAESNCEAAIKIFQKALEQKPNGVEALTGMGYCHIDAKQFASAFSNFRAALAVSPRNERALWGIAEAYQQQGRKEQAADSYKAYLAVYPDSAAAKKQLERLGVDAYNTPSPGSGATPTPPPTAPTPPAGSGDQPVTSP